MSKRTYNDEDGKGIREDALPAKQICLQTTDDSRPQTLLDIPAAHSNGGFPALGLEGTHFEAATGTEQGKIVEEGQTTPAIEEAKTPMGKRNSTTSREMAAPENVGNKKLGNAGPPTGRRRMSGGVGGSQKQRWIFHGANVRDPLSLNNLKPDTPAAAAVENSNSLSAAAATTSSSTVNKSALEDEKQGVKSNMLFVFKTKHKLIFSRKKRARNDSDGHQQFSVKKPFLPTPKGKGLSKMRPSSELQQHQKDWPGQQQPRAVQKEAGEGKEEAIASSTGEQQPCLGQLDGQKVEGGGEEAGGSGSKTDEHKRAMSQRYRYGNFNQYQLKRDFRHAAHPFNWEPDQRVEFFCPDWFIDSSVLDIGCNAGRFTISLARRFQPRRVIGIDLDQHLVGAARKNIRQIADKDTKLVGKFPASFPANFGPISTPSTASSSSSCAAHFPDNVWFICENYVLASEQLLENVPEEEFSIIFALSLTKWVHLNWGDAGIKMLFRRAYRQLRTGGRFVLETAPYKDYKRHCAKRRGRPDGPPEEISCSKQSASATSRS